MDMKTSPFPQRKNFEFIYWGGIDNLGFDTHPEITTLIGLLNLVSRGGKLILGFYDSDILKNKKIKNICKSGLTISGIEENNKTTIVWIDKVNKE